MKSTFKKRFVISLIIAAVGFVVLFLFRFAYGYTTGAQEVREEYFSDFFEDVGSVKKNYASDKYKFRKESYDAVSVPNQNQSAKSEVNVEQKYEKTATIKSRTTRFEDDEKKLRDHIKSENGIIQYEQNSGGKGNRELHLMIGIPPERFDTVYLVLQKIGSVRSKEVTKIDKTNEFKNLNAKKASLEITRQSLLEIKKQSGKIDEYINLQNRILEIEQELQNLGVALGDFDEENEFCTVRFSLAETRIVTITMLHRLKVAFEWAVQYYLLLLCILAAGAFSGFFILLIIDKVLPSIINRVNQ